MTDTTHGGPTSSGDEQSPEEARGPVIRDKRRLDPETGQVREAATPEPAEPAGTESDSAFGGDVGDALPGGEAETDVESGAQGEVAEEAGAGSHPDTALAADRLEDLRRLQAEYVNYKRRVDRDRERERAATIGTVVEALLPVLDDIHSAREHGDLTEGPFASIAEKLESTLGRFGVERVGQVGDPFDPTVHEALMHLPQAELPEGSEGTTIVQVMQPGFRVGDRVVRAARVAVADAE